VTGTSPDGHFHTPGTLFGLLRCGLFFEMLVTPVSKGDLSASAYSIQLLLPEAEVIAYVSQSAAKNSARRSGGNLMASEDQIFTIKELSEHLRVHPTTIYRLLRQGRLPGFRVGSNWRFNRAAIEEWEKLQASELQPPASRGRHKTEKGQQRIEATRAMRKRFRSSLARVSRIAFLSIRASTLSNFRALIFGRILTSLSPTF
jgi:excisionase family DNA binding protein